MAGFQGSTGDALDDGFDDVVVQGFPTFVVRIIDEPIGNIKSMISLANAAGSSVVIKIKSIKIVNSRITATTGIIADFRLLRTTGHSGGVLLTPMPHDTQDVLNASVSARTPVSLTGVGTVPLYRWQWSSDEWSVGTSDVESFDHAIQSSSYGYLNALSTKPITLRAGEGVTINQVTNSVAGTFDIEIIFTQETS